MQRKLAVLAGVLVFLIAASTFLVWRSGRTEANEPLRGLAPDKIAKIMIDRAGVAIVLERASGAWRMTAPVADLADQENADDLLAGLISLSIGSEVSREPESYPAYDLSESSATRVRLFTSDGKEALDGYFGKPGLGYDSLYFRRFREKPIYLTSGVAAYRVGRGASDLRERALGRIAPGEAMRATIRAGAASYDLVKSSGAWSVKNLAAEKAESLITKLVGLRAADFARGDEAAKETGLDKPAFSVEIAGAVKDVKFAIGKPRAEKAGKPLYRFARVEGRSAILLLPAADVDALLALLKPARGK